MVIGIDHNNNFISVKIILSLLILLLFSGLAFSKAQELENTYIKLNLAKNDQIKNLDITDLDAALDKIIAHENKVEKQRSKYIKVGILFSQTGGDASRESILTRVRARLDH